MNVQVLHSTISDNVFYLLEVNGEVALIDPIDSGQAIEAVGRSGGPLKYVLNTHWHPDHVAGDAAVLSAFPNALLVSGPDFAEIEGQVGRQVDLRLCDGDSFVLGGEKVDVIETPGHTAGHVSFRVGEHLFSGDTIFAAGCGHCRFGGDAGVLARTFNVVIPELSESLKVYPGHDYAIRNLEFVLMILPDHPGANVELKRRQNDGFRIATLGEERLYNLFMRASDVAIQDALRTRFEATWSAEEATGRTDAEVAFRVLRTLRNGW